MYYYVMRNGIEIIAMSLNRDMAENLSMDLAKTEASNSGKAAAGYEVWDRQGMSGQTRCDWINGKPSIRFCPNNTPGYRRFDGGEATSKSYRRNLVARYHR